jgi:hypothetical protein
MNLSEINLNTQDWRKFKSLICTPNFHYAMRFEYIFTCFFFPKDAVRMREWHQVEYHDKEEERAGRSWS